ncbi:MAG: citrate lyase acyl carrier protein [Clostridia bacterium]|nr:citrate lyase acyl carrier protein [Clostridia bacterium]
MEIKKEAAAGTLESSDVLVQVLPNPGKGLDIDLESVVLTTFGEQIRKTVNEVCKDLGVTDARLILKDKGAIDCVIRARVQAALCRASETKYNWEGEDKNG